jgi:hypothetical protein
MSTATLSIDGMPRRQGWRSLYWMTPIAAVYIALTFTVPAINASGVLTVVIRLAVHVFIAMGLWLGLERSELTPSQRRATWLAVMIPLTLWLALAWSAAINGFFNAADSDRVILFARLISTIIGVPILLGSRRIGQVLDAIPAGWIIALQLFRLQGALFLVGWAHHTQPAIFGLPVGIADVLIGLLAVPIALSLTSGSRTSRHAAIAWNVFGLVDFAYATSVRAAISLHVIETGFANAVGGTYPAVMIGAFGVPLAILLHAVSLRQLVRRNRAATH